MDLVINKKFIEQLVVASDGDTHTRKVATLHMSATGVESDNLRKGGTVRAFIAWAEILNQLVCVWGNTRLRSEVHSTVCSTRINVYLGTWTQGKHKLPPPTTTITFYGF